MRVVAFDTESTDLSASWGHLLCATFADIPNGEPRTWRIDKRPARGKNPVDDHKLVVKCRDEIESADMIYGWNSILHDLPLINARLAFYGERYVNVRSHLDGMFYAGGVSLKIGSRKLENVAKFLELENQKTPLLGQTWQLAGTGDRAAMDEVVVHCIADVKVLQDLWPYLAPLVKKFQAPLSAWWKFIEDIPAEALGKR